MVSWSDLIALLGLLVPVIALTVKLSENRKKRK